MSIGMIFIMNTSIYLLNISSSVNYKIYRSLDNKDMYYYEVNLSKGDCLFLPSLWIHQVRSKKRNIAVNYWLSHERVKNAIVDRNTCLLTDESDLLRLDTIRWPKELSNIEELRNYMFQLIEKRHITFKQWTKEFSKVKQNFSQFPCILCFSGFTFRASIKC